MSNEYKTLAILVAILCWVASLFVDSIRFLGVSSLLVLVPLIVIDYAKGRRIRLIHIWQLSFIYIVVAEMLANYEVLEMHPYGLTASRYLILGNLIFTVGYLIKAKRIEPRGGAGARGGSGATVSQHAFNVLLVLCGIFLLYAIPVALQSATMGRSSEFTVNTVDDLASRTLFLGLGMVLPASIAHYIQSIRPSRVRRLAMYAAILLIFGVFVAMGTRYYLLFCAGGFFVIRYRLAFRGIQRRKLAALFAIVLLVGAGIGQLKDLRVSGFSGAAISSIEDEGGDVFSLLANKMSPEGVVKIDADIIHYFESHDYLYGVSSSFLLYFWIPRVIWADKPTMLSYWMVREYESGFSTGHSASVGFFGDLYSDFGVGVFPILFFLGMLLARIEVLVFRALASEGKRVILGAMAYPTVFFAVRSPVTSLINLIGIYISYRIIASLIYRRRSRYPVLEAPLADSSVALGRNSTR